MNMQSESLASRVLTKQWSFFWAGIGFGIAQIIYMAEQSLYDSDDATV